VSDDITTTYVLVSGDFTTWGGMDRANYALAWYLADGLGVSVHLVAHGVAEPLASHRNVTWHRVDKPFGRYGLASPVLASRGRRVARELSRVGARVVVNGGNCVWSDVNWIHAVHAAWANRDTHAPRLFRLRNGLQKHVARRAEGRALRTAATIITNSRRARSQVIEHVGVPPECVTAVYYGIDPTIFRPASRAERDAARSRLGWTLDRPVVLFIGALGHDRNKGVDVLVDTWRRLCADERWDVDLVLAGGGAEVDTWRATVAAEGLERRIDFFGFTKQIPDLLAAADALVSPTHYDAYGLGVHEALCCGLPAFVTRSAGVAERYPESLSGLLLDDPPQAADLAARMRSWRERMPEFRVAVAPFGEKLRTRTWDDMARDIKQKLDDTR